MLCDSIWEQYELKMVFIEKHLALTFSQQFFLSDFSFLLIFPYEGAAVFF